MLHTLLYYSWIRKKIIFFATPNEVGQSGANPPDIKISMQAVIVYLFCEKYRKKPA
jgi:hypothetical protein